MKKFIIDKFNENTKLIQNLKAQLENNNILLDINDKIIKELKNEIIKGKKELLNNIIDINNDKSINMENNKSVEDNEINLNEKNNSISFIKTVKDKDYSYECINKVYLISYTDEAKLEIILRNKGKKRWPKGKTKLIPGTYSILNEKEIILKPQSPGEINSYMIICKGLKNHKVKEYKSYLRFSVYNKIIGETLKFSVIIKEKRISTEEENFD